MRSFLFAPADEPGRAAIDFLRVGPAPTRIRVVAGETRPAVCAPIAAALPGRRGVIGRAPVGVVARAKVGVSGSGSVERILDVDGVADRRPNTLFRVGGVVGRAIDAPARGVVGRSRTIEWVGVGVDVPP